MVFFVVIFFVGGLGAVRAGLGVLASSWFTSNGMLFSRRESLVFLTGGDGSLVAVFGCRYVCEVGLVLG